LAFRVCAGQDAFEIGGCEIEELPVECLGDARAAFVAGARSETACRLNERENLVEELELFFWIRCAVQRASKDRHADIKVSSSERGP
jgi:hypothetical protein